MKSWTTSRKLSPKPSRSAPDDGRPATIRKIVHQMEAHLIESARNQKEMASKVVERSRHQLPGAERAEIVVIHGSVAAKKVVSEIEAVPGESISC